MGTRMKEAETDRDKKIFGKCQKITVAENWKLK